MSHKPLYGFVALGVMAVMAPRTQATAQEFQSLEVSGWDVALGAVGIGLNLWPEVVTINEGPAECGPCSRASVPAVDRWAIVGPRPGMATATDVGLLALGTAAALELYLSGGGVTRELAVLGESFVLAAGLTTTLKDLVGRKRPVLYTDQAAAAVADRSSLRSWPSGHSAGAFALATSYVLVRNRSSSRGITTPESVVAIALAVTVSTLRVASGKHFPSDVVSGALIGAGSAILAYELSF